MIIKGAIGDFVTRTFGGSWVAAITFGPFIFLSHTAQVSPSETLINHERIHIRQQLELLFIGQWILYGLFYLQGRSQGLDHRKAYRANPFEEEAYKHQHNLQYLENRSWCAWRT